MVERRLRFFEQDQLDRKSCLFGRLQRKFACPHIERCGHGQCNVLIGDYRIWERDVPSVYEMT